MLIVSDSGSTKADWLLTDYKDIKLEFNTPGFNPFFHDEKYILTELNHNRGLVHYAKEIKDVKFFGAGCSSPERNKIIESAFSKFFTGADVLVDHDMLGACLAASGNSPAIVCILGTGSNACYYDGKEVAECNHGLGYILGDEGSGSWFGKKLLSYYIYKLLPPEIENEMRQQFHLTKESIVSTIYNKPNANVFLASFAKYLSSHKEHRFIVDLVRKGFTEFYETNIAAYPESKKFPVHFIGSIAFHFNHILKEVAHKNNFTIGNIIVKPVDELLNYFVKKKNKN